MAKTSTTFERRNQLLALLHERPGVRVTEIARLLRVAEGTIRNDLIALSKEGLLERVRGGGVPIDDHPALSEAFANRMRVKDSAKQEIARWAAELVDDGDTILLDASTSVYYMTYYLKERHGLTVITNGIEAGRRLAQNSTNTVFLLGGMLNSNGVPVTDLVSDQFLRDLHIKQAFVSSSGFSPEIGLTERDIREAQIKQRMVQMAESVVALVDSSKFGRSSVAPFARLEQIAHLFTDSGLEQAWIDRLKATCLTFSVCGKEGAADYTPSLKEDRHFRIGFANLGENMPFAVDVRRGVERAAQAAGNIDLVLADNQLDGQVALKVAERMAAQNLDLMIEYQIDEQAGNRIMAIFQDAGIPVISVDIPMIGATFFGVDNYRAGYLAGVALGSWVHEQWNGQFDHLIILEEPRAGAVPATRLRSQLEGFESIVGPMEDGKRLVMNSGNTREISEQAMTTALKKLPKLQRLVVLCFNDDAAIGALEAARNLGREQDIVIVGQGADRRVREELTHPSSRIIGSTAYSPEKYGERLIPLALRILRGDPVPPAVYMEHTFIHAVDVMEKQNVENLPSELY
ncbi:MAG TPA: substrate-binding domain-containing protein [Anaerolineaceae bacterium]|nr:substrate-binding domain-containing protein [Anaerolineaceae bacterium]